MTAISLESLQRLVSAYDTKANITALTVTPVEVLIAYATDTSEFGIYAGGAWHWIAAPAGFATPAIVLGTAAAAGASATVIRSDATIVAFDSSIPLADFGSGSAGTGGIASRSTHVHPGSGGNLLIADTHSTPLVFDDILQTEAGDDFLYAG